VRREPSSEISVTKIQVELKLHLNQVFFIVRVWHAESPGRGDGGTCPSVPTCAVIVR